jgi:extradiol dioxygenase
LIQSLAYVGFSSLAVDAWLEFGPEVLGLQVGERGPDGAVRLRVDDATQRIILHPGATDDLGYLGWSVAGPLALEAAVVGLQKRGFEVHRGDADLVQVRAVADLAWFVDPFGFRHELAFGLATRPASFRPGRPLSGFVTGAGGLGHVVLILPDLERAERFYMEAMGFRLSDRIEDRGSLRFFHCNPRHHSLAFAAVPGMVGVHHLMLEVGSLDDVGTAFDLCQRRNVPVATGLGRHTNDLMTSFYLHSPSGFQIEYGWGGMQVEDDRTWVVKSYDAQSIWGHKPVGQRATSAILRPFGSSTARS